ncbi:response regulator transcription factor [Listeria aquatica]|uniref:Response regulator transcription factor n=1 Tax=Listeria aquatica TaxID=1494960 RepID=A0A841ZPB9_9LIST|nr:response regulator transcription factor [Listeria aquatica]MBC1522306.1 response regulator transcription factor [Listeria aquatica]
MIRIMVVDDHVVVRRGLSYIINEQSDMQVVSDAADGLEAMMKLEQNEIDVILMDLSMPPGENGLVTTKKIKEVNEKVKVLIMTMHDDEEYLFRALKVGASGYLLKNAYDEEMLEAIRAVYGGGIYIHPSVAPALVREFLTKNEVDEKINSYELLSKREQEILPLIALGYGNKEIAEKLFVSVKTVEAHKTSIMHKLGFEKRTDLVHYAIKKNLIDL